MNRRVYHITGFFLAAFFGFLLAVNPVAADSLPPLRMIVIPMKPPSQMYRDFLPLKRYMERKLSRPIELSVARKNSNVKKLFRKKEIDIAFVCPTLYCELSRTVSVVPLVKLRIHGSDQYRSVLVVRRDSPIRRTADLFDRTLVYGRYNCPGSGLLPRIMMKRVGLSEDDFLEVVNLGNDESALLAVMGRMFDVTGVPEMAARSLPDKGLRILRYSDPIPQYLFVARRGVGEKLIRRFKEAMLNLNNTPDKEAVIGGIDKGVDGFSDARDSDYDIVRVLIESLNGGTALPPIRKGEHTLLVEPLFYDADLFRRLKPLLSKLREKTGVDYHLRIPESIDAFLRIKKQGSGDLFLQESHLFSTSRDPHEESLGLLSIVPSDMNAGVIIVSATGKVKSLEDLHGKKVGIPSRLSEGGYLAQARWLKEHGVSQDSMNLVDLKTCENVLMCVYRGRVDAGYLTLDTLRRLKRDFQSKRIVILGKTPPLKDWVLSVRDEVPDATKEKIRRILARKKRSSGDD